MYAVALRARRWPLALTLVLVGACADDTTSPTFSAPLRPNAAVGDVYLVTTPYDNGAIGSLRWALKFTTGGETIRFDPSLAGQTVSVDSTIRILKTVTIEGPAGSGITIDGSASTARLFTAEFPGTVTFRNVAITGADPGNTVGPVYFGGANVVFENSLIHGNGVPQAPSSSPTRSR